MACMRDPRHAAGPRASSSRDEPSGAVVGVATGDDDIIVPATRDIYRRDWAEFAAWCRSNDADPAALPVSPMLVADYLATLASNHGASAVRRRVAAIADHHRRRGIDFSAADPAISKVLRGLPRRHRQPVQPAALTDADLPQLIATCQAGLPGMR